MDERRKGDVYSLALAGLLHDVGKFAQRTKEKSGDHTEIGSDVVRRYVPEVWRHHLYPVMGHHDKPLQGRETKVVALADRLSAGERRAEAETQPRQLLSIFCSLNNLEGEETWELAPRYWPLKALALDEDVLFPAPAWKADAVKTAYQNLWEAFAGDLGRLGATHAQDGNLPVYLESLLGLMQRYTWSVPSAYYRSLPDVSLYDHSRTTAALAACISERSEAWLDEVLQAPGQHAEPVALLVGGDVSGVQDFIYTITARGATSALRGRSFYLQLLTEVVARYVLRRLDLPITNLIYQGGGGFQLLARPEDAERLSDVQREVGEILYRHHGGELYLALASECLAARDFYGQEIATRWERLAQQQQAAKQRRFADLPGARLHELFAPQGHGGNEENQCHVCGREYPAPRDEPESESPINKCPPCLGYEALGKDLREADYLWLERWPADAGGAAEARGTWRRVLGDFGYRGGVISDLAQLPNDGRDLRTIWALKDAALNDLHPGRRTAVGRRFLVNVTPKVTADDLARYPDEVEVDQKPGDVKPYALLAAQSQGISRLGVLRMDVDDLGRLFAEGFGKHASLSRIAALSFAVGLYFEGWVERLAATLNQERGDLLYSIYSGGDDLFFVGAWDATVALARLIRRDLTRFAASHPALHASAGIVLIGKKYPLAQAAERAKEAEDQAKAFRRSGEQGEVLKKDAVTFLGQTHAWSNFGLEAESRDTVAGMQKHLSELVTDHKAPRALLRRLIRLQMQVERVAEARRRVASDRNRQGDEQLLWGPWMWQGYYALKQLAKQHQSKAKLYTALDDLAEALHGENFKAIHRIGLAARWAELAMRET